METIVTRKTNVFGLVLLYAVLTVVGCAVSVLYIFANYYSPIIQLSVVFLVIYAIILSAVVKYSLVKLKIDSKGWAVLVIGVAFLTIMYFKWNLFYAIHYLRYSYSYAGYEVDFANDGEVLLQYFLACVKYPNDFFRSMSLFNRTGTWTIDESTIVSGVMLWVVWAVECAGIIVPMLVTGMSGQGVLVYNEDTPVWAEPKFVAVPFDRFDEFDFDKLNAGDISVITERPLAEKPSGAVTYRLALYTVNNEFIGVAAVYTFINFAGFVIKKMSSKPIELGKETAERLNNEMEAKYSPKPSEPVENTDEFFVTDSTDSVDDDSAEN